MSIGEYWTRARGKYYRTSARWLFRRPLAIEGPTPVISFTFDDFPKSALRTGGEILRRFGLAGTYYASLGIMGRQEPSGSMFTAEDLEALCGYGHEIGCHTFGHHHSWETKPAVFEGSVVENQQALAKVLPGVSFETFSYPIEAPRAQTKRRIAKYFVCCRGGGQTLNAGTADLNYLAAFFLEKSAGDPEPVKRMIDLNRQTRGWLIFATHDVCENPSPYGCTPEFFEEIVQYAVASGARVLPVVQAWRLLCNGGSDEIL